MEMENSKVSHCTGFWHRRNFEYSTHVADFKISHAQGRASKRTMPSQNDGGQ